MRVFHGNYVMWDGQPVPRVIAEVPYPPPGTCVECGGIGMVPVDLGDDRYNEMFPCRTCNRFSVWCGVCRKWLRMGTEALHTHDRYIGAWSMGGA
jgi:hypothetical protein